MQFPKISNKAMPECIRTNFIWKKNHYGGPLHCIWPDVSQRVSSCSTEMAESIKQWLPDLSLHNATFGFSARLTRAHCSVPGNIRAFCPQSEVPSTACACFAHLGLLNKFLCQTLLIYFWETLDVPPDTLFSPSDWNKMIADRKSILKGSWTEKHI